MMENCKICSKPRAQHSEYCCPEHYRLDTQRYTHESIRGAIERRSRRSGNLSELRNYDKEIEEIENKLKKLGK